MFYPDLTKKTAKEMLYNYCKHKWTFRLTQAPPFLIANKPWHTLSKHLLTIYLWAVSAVLLAHFSGLASLFAFPTLSCQLHLPRSRSRPQGCVQSHLPMISPKDVPMKLEALIPPSFHFTALEPFSIRMTVWPPKHRCLITSCRLRCHRGENCML